MKQRRLFTAQRGAAIIAALLVTALAAALAASLLIGMDDWLERVALDRDKRASRELARSAIDYARIILAEDGRRSAVDTPDEGWARKLPPVQAEDAELGGQIEDLQGRWNLNNLSRNGLIDEQAVAVYRTLLNALGLPVEQAAALTDSLADWLDSDDSRRAAGAENAYYQSLQPPYPTAGRPLDQLSNLLRIKGYTPSLVERLTPYVTVLPGQQPVNINTAPAEVLHAIQPGLDLDAARRLVQTRRAAYFRDLGDYRNRLPEKDLPEANAALAVGSSYFLVRTSARLHPPNGVVTRLTALLHRPQASSPTLLWITQQ